tara:strand:+ start:966 stop:1424 length:459 start_codon:yes stop_codon:yes gene_type:complete
MDTYKIKITVTENWNGSAGVYGPFSVTTFVEGRSPDTAENKALRAWFGSPATADAAGAVLETIQVSPMDVPQVNDPYAEDNAAIEAMVTEAHDQIRAGAGDYDGQVDGPVDHEIPHYQGMTAKELKSAASVKGVVNYSRMLKADLIAALVAA